MLRQTIAFFIIAVLMGVCLPAGASTGPQTGNRQSILRDRYLQAIKYGAGGEFEKARAELEDIVSARYFEEPLRELLDVVTDVLEQGEDHDAAVDLFKGIVSLEATQFRVGSTYVDKALEISLLRGLPYFYRGSVHFAMEEYPQALTALNQAIKVNPGLAHAWGKRGAVYYKMNDFVRALSDSDRALDINESLATVYFYKGAVYTKIGEYENAVSEYDKAISNNPYYADAYNNRGILQMVNTGAAETACPDFKKLCDLGNCMKYRRLATEGYCK